MQKEIRIDGMIGGFENSSEEILQRISDLDLSADDELKVIINSGGGSVFDGFAIYNALISLPNKVTTKVEGLSASIATLIMLAGETVEMSDISMMMIHNASAFVEGTKEELEKQADTLSMIDSTLKKVYASKTGETEKRVTDWMDSTTWFDSAEALRLGFVDEIVDKVDAKMAAQFKKLNKNKVMKLTNFFKNMVAGQTAEQAKAKAELEAKEKAELEAKEKDEADEAENNTDDQFVTVEMFENLVTAVTALTEKLEQNAEESAKAMEQKFEELVAKLPRTKGVPATTAKLKKPSGEWVDPQAKFRARMKAIENETRNK